MLHLVRSSTFRHVKRAEKRGKDSAKLRELLTLLMEGKRLPASYKNHPLKGAWYGYQDAHIEPDWLLIYRVTRSALHLARTGTHADLFDE